MKMELQELNMKRFIADCDENYNEVFAETIDLVNRWKKIHQTSKPTNHSITIL